MKTMKKIITFLFAGIVTVTVSLAGCSFDFKQNNIAQTVDNSVSVSEQYTIVYEVVVGDGTIKKVAKAKDCDGNICFQSGNDEMLLLFNDGKYTLHEKNSSGLFVSYDSGTTYNSEYVSSQTEEFLRYAEKSKEQFNPGMESKGELKVLERNCIVYSIKVGIGNTVVEYSVLVDEETGVCLGWDENKMVAGYDLDVDGEIFTCTEFITENVASLETLLKNAAAN